MALNSYTKKLTHFKTVLFLHLLKTRWENLKFPGVFRGYTNGTLASNGLNEN